MRDKRRFDRVFFSEGQVVEGAVSHSGVEEGVKVRVLNLSEGGLFFTIGKEISDGLDKDHSLVLHWLHGLSPFNFPGGISLEIKWVMNHSLMNTVGFGCEFIGLTDQQIGMIRAVVVACLVKSRQNRP